MLPLLELLSDVRRRDPRRPIVPKISRELYGFVVTGTDVVETMEDLRRVVVGVVPPSKETLSSGGNGNAPAIDTRRLAEVTVDTSPSRGVIAMKELLRC